MNLFKSKKKAQSSHEDRLDQVLYTMPGTNTPITWADVTQGTLITGSTGSGKSSGPGRFIAHAMLKAGLGMMILCAKKDERKRWMQYIEEAAPERTGDVVVFNKESNLKFNFLEYEMSRAGEGSGDVMNIIEALIGLNEQNKVYVSGGSSGKDERFWDLSLRRLISRCVTTLRMAQEEVSITNMRRLVSDCFRGDEAELYQRLEREAVDESIDPHLRSRAQEDLKDWIDSNYFLQVLLKLMNGHVAEFDPDELDICLNYWLKEFPHIGEKASSIIIESFMGIVEPFLNRGILKNQFTSGLSENLLPENIYKNGAIVILDYALKEYGLAGLYAASIVKTTFQAAMERRSIDQEEDPKPVGFWVDEYQQFCSHKTDSLFSATARSSWVATVYITQNITSLYYVMGNDQPEAKAKSLLGNLNLKIFASNDNYDTNVWASNMIGKHLTEFQNVSYSKEMDISKTKTQQMHHRISPDHFTTLKTGRKTNDYIIESVVFKAGKLWGKEKRNYALVNFNQRS
ncbi:MAG: TraM recognition domain-containing protein [Cytophagales bacterium]|nr:TraM recognition domain-containing protein [Cytophagales bacterium]